MNATTVVSAYIIGVIVLVACLVLAIISANAIRYEAGVNPQDKKKRKIWFWVLAVLTPIATLAVAYFAVYQGIKVPSRQTAYLTAMAISSGIGFVAYIVIGFVLSKAFSHGKLGSWF